MAVNYNDRRFQQVNAEKQTALNNVNNTYNNMINNSDKFYNDQIKAAEDYGNKQQELQQQNTDFTIEKIEQQKDYAKKDYIKEQKGAYADWQKQSNQYGANAEKEASLGMSNTGYSESSQVSMYNTYQNRISTARESFNRATVEYDNSIKEAQLANNSALAEIAYNTLKTKLELNLEGFKYKNTLIQQKLTAQNETEDRYYNRWKDVLAQINTENELAEEQRQFNLQLSASRSSSRSGGSGSSGKSGSGEITTAYYSGKLPSGTSKAINAYGTFSNGYQPKGIVGYGTVSQTGKTQKVTSTTLQGTKTVTNQNIWKTADGTKWIWNGMKMSYEKVK